MIASKPVIRARARRGTFAFIASVVLLQLVAWAIAFALSEFEPPPEPLREYNLPAIVVLPVLIIALLSYVIFGPKHQLRGNLAAIVITYVGFAVFFWRYRAHQIAEQELYNSYAEDGFTWVYPSFSELVWPTIVFIVIAVVGLLTFSILLRVAGERKDGS